LIIEVKYIRIYIGKLKLIENNIVDRLKRDPKPCKYFSKQYMLNVKMLPINIQSKWEKEVHKGVVDFRWFLYKMYIAQFLLAHIYIERNL
jgi:hypothetical protein